MLVSQFIVIHYNLALRLSKKLYSVLIAEFYQVVSIIIINGSIYHSLL